LRDGGEDHQGQAPRDDFPDPGEHLVNRDGHRI
jgi:hypothetical protein